MNFGAGECDQFSHTIDPDGEVTIVLQNANAPFAVWPGEYNTNEEEYIPDELSEHEYNSTNEQEKDPENKDIKYQVSAKHLTLASSVFAKALSPKWHEGSTLQEKGSVEIIVDGWDPEALLIFFRIIHCRFDYLPKMISLELLAKIVVVAAYYQCIATIRIFADIWMKGMIPPRTYDRNLMLWLLLYTLLRPRLDCKELRHIAIKQSTGLIPTLGLPFPGSMIGDLNKKREKLIGHIILELQSKVDHMSRFDNDGCYPVTCFECTSFKLGALIKLMIRESVSPWPTLPYNGLGFQRLSVRATGSSPTQASAVLRLKFPVTIVFLAWIKPSIRLLIPDADVPGVADGSDGSDVPDGDVLNLAADFLYLIHPEIPGHVGRIPSALKGKLCARLLF
ncbi:uncharacterized protein KD926_010921 [Aspergillus affinis]|uniref:uncharacterized protein n=1 Tax=Aspergillus affinis TaxID=1070780 RepID=UPI0022FED5CA|nr:uncharacterized protein KD926_010921 [Aspergillus affinis]KAI9038265.1 hypothetical protein KD926_010921 [Aspergillus affinis]